MDAIQSTQKKLKRALDLKPKLYKEVMAEQESSSSIGSM